MGQVFSEDTDMYLKKGEIIDKIFYITIGCYFVFSAMTLTMLEDIAILELVAKLSRYICYALLLVVIVCNIITNDKGLSLKRICVDFFEYFKSHLLLVAVLVNTFFILLFTGVKAPFIMMLLIWTCSFYDFDKIFALYFKIMASFMVCTGVLSILGIVPEIIIWRGDRQRFSIGFIYPLETMTFFLFLVICYVYIKKKEFGIKDFFEINIVAGLLYVATNARTSYLLVLVVLCIALMYSKTPLEEWMKKIPGKVYAIIPLACAGVSICGGLFYNPQNSIWQKIDALVSGRLALTSNAFRTYDFTLWGEAIEWVGFGGTADQAQVAAAYNFVDCAYARLLLDYGIVFTCFVLAGYMYMYIQAEKKQDYGLIVALSVVMVVSIMEPRLVSIEMNPFLLLLGEFFLLRNRSSFEFVHE